MRSSAAFTTSTAIRCARWRASRATTAKAVCAPISCSATATARAAIPPTERVRVTLAGMGYQVKVNDPYKGVELVRAYSNPKAGRHSLQIEINKRLYMDDKTLQKTEGFNSLRRSLSDLLKEISKFIQGQ